MDFSFISPRNALGTPRDSCMSAMLVVKLSVSRDKRLVIQLFSQARKSSPKSKFWGRTSRARPHSFANGRLGAKTSVRSETGRIRFRRVLFQTPNSVSFFALSEFRGESSVSSSRPTICVTKRTHRVFAELTRVCPKTQ